MVNNANMKKKRRQSILPASVRKGWPPFRRPTGRGSWWGYAALALFFLGLPLMCCLPHRFQSDLWVTRLVIGLFVLFIGMMAYAIHLITKDRVAFIAATLEAPQDENLLTYIPALFHDGEKMADQAAPIVCELLGRLSEEQLACIPDQYWICLCPRVEDTRSGYFNEKKRDRNDQVQVAVFTAIMRMKRMKSLPYIESWMKHRNKNRHSGAFVRTLHACHEALLNHQAGLQHSSTLLRPSSAEAAIPEELLRPVMGTHPSETDTGEQLLRASIGQDPCVSDRKEMCLPVGDRDDVIEPE